MLRAQTEQTDKKRKVNENIIGSVQGQIGWPLGNLI